jgi:hypothetical protein
VVTPVPTATVGRPRGRRRSVGRGRVGRAIEPRYQRSGVPTSSDEAEGNIGGGVFASRHRTPRGLRTWACTKVSMRENREIRRSPVLLVGAGRAGKAEAVIP